MLSVKHYSKDYITFCKQKIENDISAFTDLKINNQIFENSFCNNLILILETMFIHRMRGQEGKDGNPLNEVRMLANSLLTNKGKLQSDTTIKYDSNKSVLKININHDIKLEINDIINLASDFFKEIESKFS